MKASKHIIVFLMMISSLFTGCDKVPINGDLDGLWQLVMIDDGSEAKDMKSERLYCSFQLHLFMLGDKKSPRHYFGYFEKEANQLRFHTFTYRSNYTEDNNFDKPMTDEEDLDIIAPWGFYSTDCTFDIELLNGEKMILRHDNTVITYRKL